MVDLTTKLGPLSIKNPFIVGGGPLTGTADHVRKCIDAGFGALVTKTASTPWFLRRYPRPLYQLVDYHENHSNSHYIPDDYTWMHREHNPSTIRSNSPRSSSRSRTMPGKRTARLSAALQRAGWKNGKDRYRL